MIVPAALEARIAAEVLEAAGIALVTAVFQVARAWEIAVAVSEVLEDSVERVRAPVAAAELPAWVAEVVVLVGAAAVEAAVVSAAAAAAVVAVVVVVADGGKSHETENKCELKSR